MDPGQFCASFADGAGAAPVVEPLEGVLGRHGERHSTALRAFLAQLHRVRYLWVYLFAQHHKADARAANA